MTVGHVANPLVSKEGEEGIVRLKACTHSEDDDAGCDDPDVIALMIEYIYLTDYTVRRW